MAHFVDDIHHRTSTRLGDIVPQFIQEQYPQFFAFVKAYFQFLEQSDTNPITPVYVPQTGVITILSGNSVVSGSGTTFTLVDRGADTDATLAQYDRIKVDTEYFTIRSVTNNTSLTLLDVPDRNFYGKSYAVETQKSVRQAAGALRQILTFHEVDQTIPDFIAYFQNTYLRDFPQQGTDTAKLVPSILNFYQSRGSEESFQFLFRALFGQEIKITYPRDYTFGTSDAVYERPTVLRVSGVPPQTIYQINTASSTATFANGEIIRASNSSVTNLGQGTVYRTINATAVEVFAVIGNVRTNPGYAVTLTGLTSGVTRTLSGNGVDTNTNTVGLVFGSSITGNVYSLENREIVGLTSNVRARVAQVRESREGTNYVLTLSLEEVLRNDVPFRVLLNSSNVADDGDRLVLTSAGIPPAQNEREIYPAFFSQEQKPDVVFQYGERISTLPLTDPLRIQANVLGTVVGFNVLSGGSDFNIGDLVYVPHITPTINGYGAIGKVISLATSQITSVDINNPGEGYYTGIPLFVDNSGTGGGSGLEGYVSAITTGQLILHADPANANGIADGDILVFTVEDPLNLATPFVYKSGREAIDYYEKGLSLSELLSWKMTVDSSTASADTLAAEGYTYLATNTSANNFVREEIITASYAINTDNKFTVNTTSNIMSVVSGTSADLYAGLQISIANGSATVQATVSEITNTTSVQLTTVPATAVTSGNVSIVGSAVIATTEVTTGTFTIASGNTTLTAVTGNTQGLLAYVPYQLSNGVASIQLTLRSITNATSAELTTATPTAVTAGTAYQNVLNATALLVREATGSFVNGATLTGSTSTHTRIQTNVSSSVSLSLEPPQFGYADWGMGIESSEFYNDSATSIIEPKLLETTIVPFYIDGIRTPVGEVETITITGTGSGYIRRSPEIILPEPLLPRTASGELLTRAFVPYQPAVLSATIPTGVIGAVKTLTGGSGYVAAGTFTVNSSVTSSRTGNNAVLQLVVGAQVDGEPRFKTTRSLASSIQHLQDESTYQPFSYVLSVDADYTQYADVVRRLVHPAGGKLLPERTWTTAAANSGLRQFETLRRTNYLFFLEESATTNLTSDDVRVHLGIPVENQAITTEAPDVTVYTRVTVPTTQQPVTTTVPAQYQAYRQHETANLASAAPTATYNAGAVSRSAGTNSLTTENANVRVALVFKPGTITTTITSPDATRSTRLIVLSDVAPVSTLTAGTSSITSGAVTRLGANTDVTVTAPGVRFRLIFDVSENVLTTTAPTASEKVITVCLGGNAPIITITVPDVKVNQNIRVNVSTGIISSYGPDAINLHGTETIESSTAAQSETSVITAPTVTVATTTP